jgi:hypothetical protein
MVIAILTYLVILVTMVYGPIAAMLVEMFPTRIRYTSMSLPYHIGNGWFGGFLPTTAFAIVAPDRQHLQRPVVPDHHRGHDLRDRRPVHQGNQGRGHLRQRLMPESCYAGNQVRRGTGGGWPVQAAFTLAALLPLVHALTCTTQQERRQSLADSVGVLLACAVRDLLNAVIRGSYGRAVAVDDAGTPLDPQDAIHARSGVLALGPFLMNSGIALAGSAYLEPALVELHSELGRPLSDTFIRAAWTAPLEAWRYASSEVGYLPGEGCSAMLDNLQDWRGTLGHGAMHSSMRYALNNFAVVPRIIGNLAPETVEAMEWLEAGIRGAAEFRVDLVAKYDASRMSLA